MISFFSHDSPVIPTTLAGLKLVYLESFFINSHSNSTGRSNPIPTVAVLYSRFEGTLEREKKKMILRVEIILVH